MTYSNIENISETLDFISAIVVRYLHNNKSFIAKLSGSNEVPPVTTAGSGIATFQLSADGKSIDYQLNLKNMNGVTEVLVALDGSESAVKASRLCISNN